MYTIISCGNIFSSFFMHSLVIIPSCFAHQNLVTIFSFTLFASFCNHLGGAMRRRFPFPHLLLLAALGEMAMVRGREVIGVLEGLCQGA